MAQPTAPDAAAVAELAASLGRRLSTHQAALLAAYLDLLTRWRRKINLVGPADWPTILAALAADSWHLADFLLSPEVAAHLGPAGGRLVSLDFGAGAGLPGIPLRMFWERGEYVLIEGRAKRATFLREAVARLTLPRTGVAEGRVEAVVPGLLAARPGTTVLCLSRAFMPWPEFLALAGRLVPGGPAVLAMTGEPPAASSIPAGFALAASGTYQAAGRARYVSLFIPVSMDK